MGRKIERHRPSDISVDPRYQRGFEEARAKAIATKLDVSLLGVPVLSRREDGTLVVIDAQHRVGGCKLAGYNEPLYCEVHDGLTLEQEASLFLRLNGGRKAVNVHDKFRAQLTAKDSNALEIAAIVKRVGLRVSKNQGRGCVCAIKALQTAHRHGNLASVLTVLRAWGDGEAACLDGTLIKSLSVFLVEYPKADTGDLARRLERMPGMRVVATLSRTHETFKNMGMNPNAAAVQVFLDIYNKGRHAGRLSPPRWNRAEEAIAAE